MKRILLTILSSVLLGTCALAQPAKTRTTSSNAAAQRATGAAAQRPTGATAAAAPTTTTDRSTLQFPTSAAMPEDVVWKRDIYRQLDLMKDKNAPMYYPVEPQGKIVNLFTYLFRLVLTGRVNAYTYKLDGNESFAEKDKLNVKTLLENQSIYFEEQNGKLTVADSDVPSAEVTRYYIKESVYLDQRTSTFSTRVTAICPVLMRGADEFSSEATPYPLFWLNYDDIASWLTRLPMMGSNLNNVSNLTADDYFTLNRYEGTIYKTNNLQGKVLANYCETDSAMVLEQKKIEKQLTDFEEGVWGHVTDSTQQDSVVVVDKKAVKKTTKTATSTSGSPRRSASTEKKSSSSASSSSSSAPRVSARRQRR